MLAMCAVGWPQGQQMPRRERPLLPARANVGRLHFSVRAEEWGDGSGVPSKEKCCSASPGMSASPKKLLSRLFISLQ